jgi:hypothetical protein
MDDAPPGPEQRTLSVRLDVQLDREPIAGRLRTDGGVEVRFVGWLGFADALTRLHEPERRRPDRGGDDG